MQKRDNPNSQPLGICLRLFGFIMDSLIAPGLKRLTELTSHLQPVEASSTDLNNSPPSQPDQETPGGHSSSEITVDFRHTNGLEKDHPLASGDKDYVDSRGRGQEVELTSTGGSEKKGARKAVSIKDGEVKMHTSRAMKGKQVQIEDELKSVVEAGDTSSKNPISPFLTNINEQSDEFIRKKREDLRRIHILEKL